MRTALPHDTVLHTCEMLSQPIRAITIGWLDAVYGGHGKVHL